MVQPTSAIHVDHDSQIVEAGHGGNVRRIDNRRRVGGLRTEVPPHQICSMCGQRCAVRCADEVRPACPSQPRMVHQSRHAFAPHPDALTQQSPMYLGHAIGAAGARVNCLDLDQQELVSYDTGIRAALIPRAEPTARNLKQSGHGRQLITSPVRLREFVPLVASRSPGRIKPCLLQYLPLLGLRNLVVSGPGRGFDIFG